MADVRAWARSCLAEFNSRIGVDPDRVEIALGEILQNILRHAYQGEGEIVARVSDLEEGVGVSVLDHAAPSDSKKWINEKELSAGGMGLPLISNSVDAFSFRALQDGNRASIYFFPDYQHLPSDSLLWAGELIEARLAKDPFQDWALWAEPNHEPWFSDLLRRSVELVERYETSMNKIPPYHNTDHFRDVLVTVAHLVAHRDSRSLTKQEHYALILAAILHDCGHPGGVATFPGEFEDRTITLIKEAELASSLVSDASETLDLTLSLIESTSPGFDLTNSTSLQLLFNEADVGPSLIPWFGLEQSSQLFAELGYANTTSANTFYQRFIHGHRVMKALKSTLTLAWLKSYTGTRIRLRT
ncbi:ATP-binding protein [Litoricolaceae bacterium]|nr:ATP-binding protein [Litorivicinaceae bacterium]